MSLEHGARPGTSSINLSNGNTLQRRGQELDQRRRICGEAEKLLNQYFVFVGKHESRHVASSLVLAYVFGQEVTTTKKGGETGQVKRGSSLLAPTDRPHFDLMPVLYYCGICMSGKVANQLMEPRAKLTHPKIGEDQMNVVTLASRCCVCSR